MVRIRARKQNWPVQQFFGGGAAGNDIKQMGLGIKRKINIPGYFSTFHLRAIQQK